jgi:3-methyladenine DNA glycosylase/8-oxoguanine DNA glycosylase
MRSKRLWHNATLTLDAPQDFNFWRTAFSHGWCDLPPFSFDRERKTLYRILAADGGSPVGCTITDVKGGITVDLRSRSVISRAVKHSVLLQLRSCLRLDENLQPFLSAARKHAHFRWIAASRSGRMLRSPTTFEDIVKMICTTNCSWALTRIMITNLVALVGKQFDGARFAFPRPADIAALSERDLRTRVKAGYRAPYLLEFARRVAEKRLDVESFRTSTLPTDELTEQLLVIKGVGPYAAENLLKLLGRYDRLGLDSWTRGRYYELHSRGRAVRDATIERHYRQYGEWRGLFFWLEMTKDWHEREAD